MLMNFSKIYELSFWETSRSNNTTRCSDLIYLTLNPFVTNGTYMSHLQRVFSSPLG
jgi:hypothetical protein